MEGPIIDPIDVLTDADIERVARLVVGDASASLDSGWNIERIGRSVGVGTVGIYHLTGLAAVDGAPKPWSVVLKALDERANQRPGASHFLSPDREVAVYRSGMLDDLPGGLRIQHIYSIDEQPNGAAWIWMEDLSSAPLPPWTDDQYAIAAKHVGNFNGHWLATQLPSADWMQVDGFATRVRNFTHPDRIAPLLQETGDPEILAGVPPDTRERLGAAIADVPKILSITGSLAQTICHLDCHPKNLFILGQSNVQQETVAIDWASVGPGPVGVDVGLFIGSGLRWQEIDTERATGLRDLVFDNYLAGLRESGWNGPEDQARFGYWASVCATGIELASMVTMLTSDDTWRSRAESLFGKPLIEWLEINGENQRLMRGWHDELMALAERLDV